MNCDSIIIDGVLYNYQYSQNNIHIENSCNIKKKYFKQLLFGILEKHKELDVWYRSIASLKNELATHNFLYSIGLWKKRTKDVDLNYPLKWYMKIVYGIVGTISLIFIK